MSSRRVPPAAFVSGLAGCILRGTVGAASPTRAGRVARGSFAAGAARRGRASGHTPQRASGGECPADGVDGELFRMLSGGLEHLDDRRFVRIREGQVDGGLTDIGIHATLARDDE